MKAVEISLKLTDLQALIVQQQISVLGKLIIEFPVQKV